MRSLGPTTSSQTNPLLVLTSETVVTSCHKRSVVKAMHPKCVSIPSVKSSTAFEGKLNERKKDPKSHEPNIYPKAS